MLKPWREVAEPHEDVRRGTMQQAEFAADITMVRNGVASEQYQNPHLFFARTYITEGMKLLLDNVLMRITGNGGDPVVQLQTAFGGGKTHTMLAVYHLATSGKDAGEFAGIGALMDSAGITQLPVARVAVLDGNRQAPNSPQLSGGIFINTLWGELAWQIGGVDGYELVRLADESGTSPGKQILSDLLTRYAPCVILVDELVAYLRQFSHNAKFAGGTFESNLSFVQALTEAVKAVPQTIILASLPESKTETGGVAGDFALDALEKVFGRIQAIWKPIAPEEAFAIVRQRLFANIGDEAARVSVCREFAKLYADNADKFPSDVCEARYFERMLAAYPIHPELFDRLYEDWTTLDRFQRTRGVLQLMAKVINRLWVNNNSDLLIMPGNLPLADNEVRNQVVAYLPAGWDPLFDKDIDGERSISVEIDKDTRFGTVQAASRLARSIFVGSAPSGVNQNARGLDEKHLMLACVQPLNNIAVFSDALARLRDKLHYLNHISNKYWFGTKPNLRREMEERKRRFESDEHCLPLIKKYLSDALSVRGCFDGVHIFADSNEVPDDANLRLVVLKPNEAYSQLANNMAHSTAARIVATRGGQPRQQQNRLIFLAPDYDSCKNMRDRAYTYLAWNSIVNDFDNKSLDIGNAQAEQAKATRISCEKSLKQAVLEAYCRLFAPVQFAQAGKMPTKQEWESGQISASGTSLINAIDSKIRQEEWLITEWAPIHLRKQLVDWFWKSDKPFVSIREVWTAFGAYLYLPRLKNIDVMKNAIKSGVECCEFFAIAQACVGDKYEGFIFGANVHQVTDDMLIIEPSAAGKYAEELRRRQQEEAAKADAEQLEKSPITSNVPPPASRNVISNTLENNPPFNKLITRYHASVQLNATTSKMEFAAIFDEIIKNLTADFATAVEISVEISASNSTGFADNLQRAVSENGKQLNINGEFVEE